ncbi:salicylate synthase [Nocardia sp. NPDC058058]|uniref:salicylate synthase n=1 Tax=Nocardia sp. NPDC058058 TaxID=3346317 RepID=UPI0036D89AF2
MTTTEFAAPETTADQVAAVSRLARSGLFGEYVVYERLGAVVFAADPLATIELDTDRIRVTTGDRVSDEPWTGRPVTVLERTLDQLRMSDPAAASGTVYGWIGFEFCARSFDAQHHLRPGIGLAHLMIPRVEVTLTDHGVTVTGASDAEAAFIANVLGTAPEPTSTPRPIDVTVDETDYRERVATAIAEIRKGQYDKVILSRRVSVPFKVDIAETYRLGRAHNTPARSFLLRLGTLEAAGFSPELVAAVDLDGTVTTEPLAGTRAFGRGRDSDSAARTDLESDPKEIVEHAVSVRASCTEVSAVATPGTLTVTDFMSVRERGSVQHLASTVQGHISPHHTPWDALEVLFPSVTASGIPKHPAVDAIFRLDNSPRNLYSGAVVTFSAAGELEATLVLRAVYQTPDSTWLRAGAGVIAQSTPDREFEETCEKLTSVSPYLVPFTDIER